MMKVAIVASVLGCGFCTARPITNSFMDNIDIKLDFEEIALASNDDYTKTNFQPSSVASSWNMHTGSMPSQQANAAASEKWEYILEQWNDEGNESKMYLDPTMSYDPDTVAFIERRLRAGGAARWKVPDPSEEEWDRAPEILKEPTPAGRGAYRKLMADPSSMSLESVWSVDEERERRTRPGITKAPKKSTRKKRSNKPRHRTLRVKSL